MTKATTDKEIELQKYNDTMQKIFKAKKGKGPVITIKETICEYDKNNPILVSHELIEDGRVILGIEYDADKKPVRAYATDEKAKKITLASLDEKDKIDTNLKNIVAERLEKFTAKEETKAPTNKAPKPDRVDIRTKLSPETNNYINTRGRIQS